MWSLVGCQRAAGVGAVRDTFRLAPRAMAACVDGRTHDGLTPDNLVVKHDAGAGQQLTATLDARRRLSSDASPSLLSDVRSPIRCSMGPARLRSGDGATGSSIVQSVAVTPTSPLTRPARLHTRLGTESGASGAADASCRARDSPSALGVGPRALFWFGVSSCKSGARNELRCWIARSRNFPGFDFGARGRLELPWAAPLDPKSSASASFATRAHLRFRKFQRDPPRPQSLRLGTPGLSLLHHISDENSGLARCPASRPRVASRGYLEAVTWFERTGRLTCYRKLEAAFGGRNADSIPGCVCRATATPASIVASTSSVS